MYGRSIKSNLSKYFDYNNIFINNKKFEVILDKAKINNDSIKIVNLYNHLSRMDNKLNIQLKN